MLLIKFKDSVCQEYLTLVIMCFKNVEIVSGNSSTLVGFCLDSSTIKQVLPVVLQLVKIHEWIVHKYNPLVYLNKLCRTI